MEDSGIEFSAGRVCLVPADEGSSGVTALRLVPSSVVHLHPEEAVWEGMLSGWRGQMRSRSLSLGTVEQRLSILSRFMVFTGEYPWQWRPSDVEDWSTDLLQQRRIAASTLRSYQTSVRLFCDYLVDARYGWSDRCLELFGSHPSQICHEWNTVAHVIAAEARPAVRPLTREEVQRLFDYADDQVEVARRLGRKGWFAAWRDATWLKMIYAFGLRRREAAMLDVADFQPNPKAPEFGPFGICQVRYGKAFRGSPPRRRSVLAVMPWSTPILAEYVDRIRPAYPFAGGPALWPTERGGRVATDYMSHRFATYRDALGLSEALHPHCLRHSYVTHLVEDGFDPFFVQQQVGHSWGSTTSLYTGVSGDFKNRSLRAALNRLTGGAGQ
jgi:integrase/recombinase XerC